jgi:membrane protease subunit (stomatin/prohibitin family)
MSISKSQKKRPYIKAILWGIVSAGFYIALFVKEGLIKEYFGKGGVYALLPILMAFLFSFVHGNFTGFFWSALGVEASKKVKDVK